MAIIPEEIEHLALLARLGLDAKEKAKITPDLAKILDYVGELQKVNTENVTPLTGGTTLQNVLRDDEPKLSPSLPSGTELLSQARETEGSAVKVPRILE
jgi:aspartyl-tRNA(Asn)/glutamyl-tRNA(Gln) amidotransferase subunit C